MLKRLALLQLLLMATLTNAQAETDSGSAWCAYIWLSILQSYSTTCDPSAENVQRVLSETLKPLKSHLIDQGGFSNDELAALQKRETVTTDDCDNVDFGPVYDDFAERFKSYHGPMGLDISLEKRPVRRECLP